MGTMTRIAALCLFAGACCSGVGIAAQLCATAGLFSQSFADLLGVVFVWLCLVLCWLAREVMVSQREARS